LLIVLGLTAMIPGIMVDTSSEALLHQDDPILLEYNRFRIFDTDFRDFIVGICFELKATINNSEPNNACQRKYRGKP
jgi:hypothetical protein